MNSINLLIDFLLTMLFVVNLSNAKIGLSSQQSQMQMIDKITTTTTTTPIQRINGTNETNEIKVESSNSNGNQCQEACLQKTNRDIESCLQMPHCFKCMNTCSIRRYHRNRIVNNSSSSWPLRIATMVKQEFLVLTHIAWERSDVLANCLVTWEVYGGGLMGTLLTDQANVELSLWPETRYRVQVTCKDKNSEKFIKSAPLIVNTSDAIAMKPDAPREQLNGIDQSTMDRSKSNHIWKKYFHKKTLVENAVMKDADDHDDDDEQNEQNEQNDSEQHQQNNWYTKIHQQKHLPFEWTEMDRTTAAIYRNMKEIVLGACAALIVFLFILTLFCAYRGSRRRYKADLYAPHILVSVDN